MSGTHSSLYNLTLSPEYMLDCGSEGTGCAGGQVDTAWKFLQSKGIPYESCDPYGFCPNSTDPHCGLEELSSPLGGLQGAALEPHECPMKCTSGEVLRTFQAGPVYAVSTPGDVKAIQHEILTHGPIEVAFFVFSDFFSYRNGTYFRTPSA